MRLRSARLLRCGLAVGAAILTLCGCATIRRTFHVGDASTKVTEQLRVLQVKSMRFADEYVGSIVQPIRQFQAATDDAADRLASQNWLLSQATAAYTIASGASPTVNAVDMVVLTTLSRMVIDDAWVGGRFGERATALRDVYRRLEPVAVNIVRGALTPDQINELTQAIAAWRAQNPHVTAISYVHFRDIASSAGRPTAGGSDSFSGLFTMLGLDPFSGLDPAVREISQTRELAERTIYYAQRVPALLDMQVERLIYAFATMPETKRLLANTDSIAAASSTAGRVIGDFPGILAGERQAAIRQFIEAISVETVNMRQLTIEARAALEAGTATANSVSGTIHTFDQLVGRFEKPTEGGRPPNPPGRPFDITEYTAAAAELTRASAELQGLVSGIGRNSPALLQAAEGATSTLQSVIDHAYWRMVQLIVWLLLGGLGVALTYRRIARRWRG